MNKKQSIAFITDVLSYRAGFIKQVIEQANYFSKLGYDVTVFTSHYDAKKCFPEIKKNFKIKSLNYKIRFPLLAPLENRFIKKNKMQSLIREERKQYEIFIIHGDPYFILSKFLISCFIEAKIVWHINDIPYSFDILLRRESSLLNKIAGPLLRMIDKYYINYLNNITTLNEVNKKSIKVLFGKKSTVVNTGVDKFFVQTKLKKRVIDHNKVITLSVGAFSTNRRYEDIIKAISILNNSSKTTRFLLRIIGYQGTTPTYYKYLVKLVDELKLNEYVTFINSATNDELKKEYYNADIFIQSTEHIGWTIPAMEAMISGNPVIITNSCGLNERLRDGVDAFIVKSRSPEQIKDKIQLLINNDSIYKRISMTGRKTILDNFMWGSYCVKYKQQVKNFR